MLIVIVFIKRDLSTNFCLAFVADKVEKYRNVGKLVPGIICIGQWIATSWLCECPVFWLTINNVRQAEVSGQMHSQGMLETAIEQFP